MKTVKRAVVAVVGGTVLLIGIALIVLPGPAFIVIPAGLAILATEFAWAKNWLGKARAFLKNRFRRKPRPAQMPGSHLFQTLDPQHIKPLTQHSRREVA